MTMSEKRYYWLKLQENFFDDDTIDFIEGQENGEKYVLFYLKLCLKALRNEGKLIRYVGELLLPYDEVGIAKLTKTDVDIVRSALTLFAKIGLIKRLETGEIYLTQLNELVGKETDSAQRKRKQRIREQSMSQIEWENVTPMSQEGHTDIEIDIDKEKEKDTYNACAQNVPAYINESVENVTSPRDFQDFLRECFTIIHTHNNNHGNSKKIPISTNMISFSQKEGRRLVEIARYEKVDRLKQALQNYLKVMDCDTWKRGFSFNAFCNNYQEYLPEYFSVEKYERSDVNPYAVCQDFINRELDKTPIRINVAVFAYHHKDWLKIGRPEGEQYYQLQVEWEKQDEINNVDYSKANAHIWEEYER